jgi:hypothetical protein
MSPAACAAASPQAANGECRFAPAEENRFFQMVREASAVEPFLRQENQFPLPPDLINLRHVRMIQAGSGPRLAQKPFTKHGRSRRRVRATRVARSPVDPEQLQRHIPFQVHIPREVHNAHPTRADLADKAIVAEHRAGLEVRRGCGLAGGGHRRRSIPATPADAAKVPPVPSTGGRRGSRNQRIAKGGREA